MTIEANVSSPLRQLMPTLVSISSDLVDSVLWVRMGDERSKHAMLQQVFQDLGDLFDAVALDDEVRVVVLTGAGRRFSTGGSVTGMAERASRQEGIDLSHRSSVLLLGRMYRNLLGVDQPVIAAVNGDAIGAGTTLALHCDIVLARGERTVWRSPRSTRLGRQRRRLRVAPANQPECRQGVPAYR